MNSWKVLGKGLIYCIPFLLPACSLTSCLESDEKKPDPIIVEYNTAELSQILLFDNVISISEITETESNQYLTNVLGLEADQTQHAVLQSLNEIHVDFAVLSPDRNDLYLSLSPAADGLRFILQEQCSIFRVDLISSISECVLQNHFNANWQTNDAWAAIKNNVTPIQFDQAGNVYILANRFLKNCSGACQLGENLDQYQRIDNDLGHKFYIQNQANLFKISDGSSTSITVSDSAKVSAFTVLNDTQLAVLAKTETELQLLLFNNEQAVTELPAINVNSLIIDDQGGMLVNGSYFIKYDSGLIVASAKNTRRENTNLALSADNEIIDFKDTLVYKSFPFEVRPVAELQASDSQVNYGAAYLFEKVSDDLIIHDLQNYNSSSLKSKLALEDGVQFLGEVQSDNLNENGFITLNQNQQIQVYEIPFSEMRSQNIPQDNISIINIDTASDVILNTVFTLTPPVEVSDFFVQEFSSLAENNHSVSLGFSEQPYIGIADHVQLQNEALQDIPFFSFLMGKYLHLILDTSDLGNNILNNGNIENHVFLNADSTYTITVNSVSAGGVDIGLLNTDTEGNTYPSEFSFSTAPESGVYHSQIDNFTINFAGVNSSLAQGGVIAKPVCAVSVCNSYYYNLGIERAGNIRIEFSSNSEFVQLALWDSFRYSQSYNRLFSPVYAFWADTTAANVKNNYDYLNYNFSDALNTELANPALWRRYRFDYYANTIEISYSIDGVNYTLLESLSIDAAENYLNTQDEYHWLMEFDGAIDNLSVSSLDDVGSIANSEGDLLQESFDTQVAFAEDATDNSIGFEENIAASLPLSSGSGSPDISFGQRGISIIQNTDTYSVRIEKMLVDVSGNTYVSGRVYYDTFDVHLGLWKIDADGVLDTSFGNNGVYIYDDLRSEPVDLAIDANDNLYVAGIIHNDVDKDVALWRFDLNGVLDVSFDEDGLVTYSTPNLESPSAVAIDSNNTIYLAGASDLGVTVWSYGADGTLNTTFNGNGVLTIAGDTNNGAAYDIEIDGGNNVLIAAYQVNVSDVAEGIVYQLTNTGSISLTLNVNDSLGITDHMYLSSMSFDNASKLLVFGYVIQNEQPDLLVFRLNTDNSVDTTFSNGGSWLYDSSGFDFSYAVEVDQTGRIYLLAQTWDSSLEVIRLTSDGAIDTTFHREGSVYKSAYAVDFRLDNSGLEQTLIIAGSSISADNHQNENALWRIMLD